MHRRSVLVLIVLAALLAVGVVAPAAPAQPRAAGIDTLAVAAIQQAKLSPGDTSTYDHFGLSVVLDGDVALVGAPFQSEGRGAAYFFTWDGIRWTQQQKVVAAGGATSDDFGYSVALDGDTALIGARGRTVSGVLGQGAVYVFTRTDLGWTQGQMFTSSAVKRASLFGTSVALNGDTAVVGAPRAAVGTTYDTGAAWVFTRNWGVWNERARLVPGDYAAGDYLGLSVAMCESTVVAGAPHKSVGGNDRQGVAYVFTGRGATWTQQQRLQAGDGEAYSLFGFAVNICGDTVAVGSPGKTESGIPQRGEAYLFERAGGAWTEAAALEPVAAAEGDAFGWAVALEGDTAIVGEPGPPGAGASAAGAAHVFVRGPLGWAPAEDLAPGDPVAGGGFGGDVALSDGRALVGAPGPYWDVAPYAGVAYIFGLPHTITPLVSGAGAVSPATAQTVAWGASRTFTFTPAAGYEVAAVTVDGVRVVPPPGRSYTFEHVTADHTIAVEFARRDLGIMASAGPHGSIAPSGYTGLAAGGWQTYTMYPDWGYHVEDVRVDGRSVGAVSTYTFRNVITSHTIAVTFAPNVYTITALVGAAGHGVVSPAGPVSVLFGATPTFAFTPERGYYASRLTVDGTVSGFTAPNRYTFAPVTGSHVLQVFFTASPR